MPLDGRELGRAYEKNELVGWSEFIYPGSVKAAWSQIGNTFCSPPIFNDYEKYKDNEVGLHTIVKKVLGNFTPNYAQQIGDCYIADSKVLMADGTEKNIQDIQIGETVINHLNQPRKVVDLVRKKYTGNLVTFKLKGWNREITGTETHDALYMPQIGYRFKFKGFAKKKLMDYEVGDHLLIPFGKVGEKEHYITIDEMNKTVKVDEKFARLIGLYLAEGGVTENSKVTFNLGLHEELLGQEVISLLQDVFGLVGIPRYNKVKQNVLLIECYNAAFSRFIKKMIPGNVYSKNIPEFFFSSVKSVRLALLRGWLDGDGYDATKFNKVTGTSSSKDLVNEFARISLSCEINPSSGFSKKEVHQRVAAQRLHFYGENSVLVGNSPRLKVKSQKLCKTPFGFARKISKISTEYVENFPVYCITVEGENTLILNGVAQYNCVSFGAKNATEYLACCDILLRKDAEQFKPVFPPFYYGSGRILIGGWEGSRSDGSLGSYMAKAVEKYGTLFSDEPNVPKYSGAIAKEWGARGALLKPWLPTTQKYLVKSAALVSTWEELVVAIANGYPCTVASSIGFSMEASSDGFHRQTTQWNHQMMIYFACNTYKNGEEPYGLILNSWADAHGRLKDFVTGEELPIGTLRVRRKDIEKMLRANETFAFSQYDGFPGQKQKIEKALFKLF